MKVWRKYNELFQTKKEITTWLQAHGYESHQVVFCMPWDEVYEPKADIAVIVVFSSSTRAPVAQYTSAGYTTIFTTPRVQIYERPTETPVLRQHLSGEHTTILLQNARAITQAVIMGNTVPETLDWSGIPEVLQNEVCTLDVAIYVDGILRGSIVSPHKPLRAACIQAASGVVTDTRFAPVDFDELARATFELHVAHDLWLPVLVSDCAIDRSLSDMFYQVDVNQISRGWFVPNVSAHEGCETLRGIVQKLTHHKAKLSASEAKRSRCVIAPTTTVFEGAVRPYDSEQFYSSLLQYLADRIDHNTGYVPIVASRKPDSQYQLDLGRIAFTYHTCQELVQKDRGVRDQLTTVIVAMEKFFNRFSVQNLTTLHPAVAVYTRDLLGDDARHDVTVIQTWDALTQLQYLRAHQEGLRTLNIDGAVEQSWALQLYRDWQAQSATAPLALFSDLVPTLITAGYTDEAGEMLVWYRSLQLADGSFPNTPQSNYVYTRGTSKVAESLALVPEAHDMVRSALRWLHTMQYTDQSVYQLPINARSAIVGGIRHDYWGHEVWLDSVCHTLLALVRMR